MKKRKVKKIKCPICLDTKKNAWDEDCSCNIDENELAKPRGVLCNDCNGYPKHCSGCVKGSDRSHPEPSSLKEIIDNHPAFDAEGLESEIKKYYLDKFAKLYSKKLEENDRLEGGIFYYGDVLKVIDGR